LTTEEQRLTKILTDHPKVYDVLEAKRSPAPSPTPEDPALTKAVEAIRKADGGLTKEQATLKALEGNPKLYEAEPGE